MKEGKERNWDSVRVTTGKRGKERNEGRGREKIGKTERKG